MREEELLVYCDAIGKAYERFWKKFENGDIVFTNEQEIRCHLYAEYLQYLREKGLPKPHHAFLDYRIDNKIIDFAVLTNHEKVIAVEIKYDPNPSGIEEDLAKLRELVDKNLVSIGIFITSALSDYKLKERLRDILPKFGLKENGESDLGFVEWHTFRRPNFPALVDALWITLWKKKK